MPSCFIASRITAVPSVEQAWHSRRPRRAAPVSGGKDVILREYIDGYPLPHSITCLLFSRAGEFGGNLMLNRIVCVCLCVSE